MVLPMFTPDIPNSIVVPAHETNVIHHVNKPRALVLHTPEEPADDYESTPPYFQRRNLGASTHYYQDNDGDLYQMVPERLGALANGLRGMPRPRWALAVPNSLNLQTLSIEIEGYAAGMRRTCRPGSRQWIGTRNWIISCCLRHDIPTDRAHVMRHDELANNRSDPGTLLVDQLVAEAATVRQVLEDAPDAAAAQLAIRAALTTAWRRGDWRTLCQQLRSPFIKAC